MKRILYVLLCLTLLLGCEKPLASYEVKNTSSQLGRRVDRPSGCWDFKYTNSGSWDLSCRPPGLMSEFGVTYWTSLKRVPSRDRNGYKVFAGSRNGDAITLIVESDGTATIYLNQDGDLIANELYKYYSSDAGKGFWRYIYLKN